MVLERDPTRAFKERGPKFYSSCKPSRPYVTMIVVVLTPSCGQGLPSGPQFVCSRRRCGLWLMIRCARGIQRSGWLLPRLTPKWTAVQSSWNNCTVARGFRIRGVLQDLRSMTKRSASDPGRRCKSMGTTNRPVIERLLYTPRSLSFADEQMI